MAYKCALCGKSYDTVSERIACESACLAKAEKDAAAKKKADQDKIKKELMSKITAKIDETTELINTYKEVAGEEPELTTTYTYWTGDTEEGAKKINAALRKAHFHSLLDWLF